MFVKDWMTSPAITITKDKTIPEAAKIMRKEKIKRLPVADEHNKLLGLLSYIDIQEYMPSEATTLDAFELSYMLNKIKVEEVMKTIVFTTHPDISIEEAAMEMYNRSVSSLPVIENDEIVGMITERDVFKELIDITGVRNGGHRICVAIKDRPGSIKEIADIVRSAGYGLESILSSHSCTKEGYRKIVLRTRGSGDVEKMKNEILLNYSDAIFS